MEKLGSNTTLRKIKVSKNGSALPQIFETSTKKLNDLGMPYTVEYYFQSQHTAHEAFRKGSL